VGWLVALLACGLGFGAYWRRRRRKRRSEPEVSPAEELRARLADSRAAETEPAEAAEPEAPEPDLEGDLTRRRREVHERARGAIDDLS
jgi:hypothetical protein